jgi:signal transduction histidine kinase
MTHARPSIAMQVIITLVAVATVLLGALGFIGYSADRERQLEKLHKGLAANADQAATGLALPVWNFDHDQIDKVIESIMQDEDVYGVEVKLADIHATIQARVRDDLWQSKAVNMEISSNNLLVEERKIEAPEEVLGVVKVFATTKFVEAALNRTLLTIAVTIFSLGVILIVSLYLLLHRTVLRPLKDIERYAAAVSSGDRSGANVPAPHFQGELANLRSSIEKMVMQLDARYTALQESGEELRRAHDHLEQRVRDRTAELVAANERLLELDRLKSQFLATMSHELRTPLNSIIGFTGLLRQGMAGPVNAEQEKQLGMVYSSGLHLLSLISDLLDLSRIEAGKMELECKTFDFGEVADEVARGLKPIAGAKGLNVAADLAGARLEITGDRKRCYQVLLNVANNAVKFTEHGSVRISAQTSGKMLLVSVTDTGIGIKPEQLPQLFEAFRQLDGSAKRIYEGTGLGLYLCRKLLSLMGGEIKVESEYGKGSRFMFTIPLNLQAGDCARGG